MTTAFSQTDLDNLNAKGIDLFVNNSPIQIGKVTVSTDALKIVARDNYTLTGTNRYYDFNTGQSRTFTISSDKKTGTMTAYANMKWENFTYTTTYTAPQPVLTITDTLMTLAENNKIELWVNDVKVNRIDGQTVYASLFVGDVLKITPLDGFDLADDTKNQYYDWVSNRVERFIISPDLNSGTMTIDTGINSEGAFTLGTVSEPVPIPPDDPNPIDNIKKGVNNVYLIDPTTARQVMRKRFDLMTGNGEIQDKTDTIIGLINVPFTIEDKYKNGVKNIMLATYDTGLTGEELITDTIIINMGVINVPHAKDDLTDYENVETVLNLPYCDPITLNKADVIGYEVSVFYWVNVYNGETIINVYSSKTGELIESRKVDLGVNVPFNKLGVTPTNNAFNAVKSTGYNGVNCAFIEVKAYDTILKDGLFTNPIIDEKTLTDERGFIEIENIELTVNATFNEKNEILNKLRTGVIIK